MERTTRFIFFLYLILLLTAYVHGQATRWVNPFIGTGGHGHLFPGATLPFGMVQLSPDTRLKGWDACSGYHYSDKIIYGFSHTHLSGTGVSDYCDILMIPTVGKIQFEHGNSDNPDSGYCSRFDKSSEKASPGYYSVFLKDYGIKVELTATERAGFHRYTFPDSISFNLICDLTHRDKVLDSAINIVSPTEVEGFRRSSSWAKNQIVYFIIKFSKPFYRWEFLSKGELSPNIKSVKSKSLKVAFRFKGKNRNIFLMKIGLSAVSIAGARKNLEKEIPDWNFERIVERAKGKWNKELNKIEIAGSTPQQMTTFYTALYHSFLCPNIFMDVDGCYRGRDLKPHMAKNFVNYTVFSLWDTFRAEHPLFTIIQRKRTVDFIKTMLAQYRWGKALPVWELAGNETNCMIGYHSVSVIADAFIKRIKGFSESRALDAMVSYASSKRRGLGPYRKYGFIPVDASSESVSKTLEYAYDDWCIAQMSKAICRYDIYHQFTKRAQNWKNIFDPETKFMRARINGGWYSPFDPIEVNFNYTEANAWQYRFFVPQDIDGLIKFMGGDDIFVRSLNSLFRSSSKTTGRKQADITGLIGQYAQGNEPSHHVAYLYNYAGKAWKTQKIVKTIMTKLYNNTPSGLCGNEDCGQMSAWYIFSALGFYPVCPGSPIYAIGSPLFPKVTIHLENGTDFAIVAKNLSAKNIYIRKAYLNGHAYSKSYITQKNILSGGKLVLIMGPEPNPKWGEGISDRPHSEIEGDLITPAPYLDKSEQAFVSPFAVRLMDTDSFAEIKYTTNKTNPRKNGIEYNKPIKISGTTTIKAIAKSASKLESTMIEAKYKKIPHDWKVKLFTRFSKQYSAGGAQALIDTIHGGKDFRSGKWQGYDGVDFDAMVDMGKATSIHEIGVVFLQNIRSWIWMPVEIQYLISNDGKSFKEVGSIKPSISSKATGTIIKEFKITFPYAMARYVRIKAKNYGKIPYWHPGHGGNAFIFVDEITIE